MSVLFIALAASAHSTDATAALDLCKAALARKVDGEISDIDVNSNFARGRGRTIQGRLILLSRMGPASPGAARANHVIRLVYSYDCRIERGKVRSASAHPLH